MKNKKVHLSAIIVAKNEEKMIGGCLNSLQGLADEVIIIDSGSTDKTVKIAQKHGAEIIKTRKKGFSNWRNLGAEKAKGEWLFYIDADERVTPELKKEILSLFTVHCSPFTVHSAFAIPRRNILLGHEMRHGGWWPDYVLRLIKKDKLEAWRGELHEQPKIKGSVGKLKEPMIHLTHRSLTEMVEKTNRWSEIEVRLMFEAGHPKMNICRFSSAVFREFWYRAVLKLGFLDGPIGIMEIIYQMFSRFVSYAKLWEMQLKSAKFKNQNAK